MPNENLIINELIREYLEFNKYKHALSVFLPGMYTQTHIHTPYIHTQAHASTHIHTYMHSRARIHTNVAMHFYNYSCTTM